MNLSPATEASGWLRTLSQSYSASRLIVRPVPITEWADEGFDSICLVAAERTL